MTPKQIGRYDILQEVGSGGAATIYLGHDPVLRRDVTVKLVHPHLANREDVTERLRREGQIIARLRHKNIPNVVEFIDRKANGHPRCLALVYEYIPGDILAQRLATGHRPALAEILHIITVVADALDAAHGAGVIHHDVKPANVLISDDRVWLVDFGLAHDESAASLTSQGDLLGTPAYMSPEQALGQRKDHRSDIYALGVTLYELLTGQVPFDAGTPHGTLQLVINAEPPERPLDTVSPAIQVVVRKALAKSPGQRHASAGELAADFKRAITATAATGHESLTDELSPRAAAIAEVQALLARGQNTMLIGPGGMGKSHILGQIARHAGRAFFLDGIGAKKTTLLLLARRLFDDGLLGDEYAYFVDFDDVRKRLNRLTVREIADEVIGAASRADPPYLLVLDRAEGVTDRSLRDIVLPLAGACTLLCAVNDDNLTPARLRVLQTVADKCKRVELPALTADEMKALLWHVLDQTQYPHWKVIETKVLDTAAGRPGAVVDLAQRLAAGGGGLAEVRDLAHSASREQRVSLLMPTIFAVIVLIMSSRFLARGLNDPAIYILASLAYASTIVLRPLLYRSGRGNTARL